MVDLIPAFTLPIGWSVHREPIYQTRVQRSVNGKELRALDYPWPLRRWTLTFNILRDKWDKRQGNPAATYDELRTLLGFYGWAEGAFRSFSFHDPEDDYAVNAWLLMLNSWANAIGDGVTMSFQLARPVPPNGVSEPVRAITALDEVYFDNAPSGASWTISDEQLGILTFDEPPPVGVTISADLGYLWRVRFVDDHIPFENFMWRLWSQRSVQLIQTVPRATPVPAETPFSPNAVFLEGGGFGYNFPTMANSPFFTLSFWVYLTGSQLNSSIYFSTPPPSGDLFTRNSAYIFNNPSDGVGQSFISQSTVRCSSSFDVINVTRAVNAVITTSSPHGVRAGSYFAGFGNGSANRPAGTNFSVMPSFNSNAPSPGTNIQALSVTSTTITTNWNTSAAPNPWSSPTNVGGPGTYAEFSLWNAPQILLSNSDSSRQFLWRTNTSIPHDQWVNVLVSADMNHAAGGKVINVYYGDEQVVAPAGAVTDFGAGSFNIQFGDPESAPDNYWNIFGSYFNPGNVGCICYFAEAWFAAGQRIDFTIPANRAKFHNASGHPKSLGVDGSLPTGISPMFYLTLPSTDSNPLHIFNNAAGTGALQFGDFTGPGGMEISPIGGP